MLTVHFLSKMFFLGSVYFASWGKSCAGAILSLNTIGWSGHVMVRKETRGQVRV